MESRLATASAPSQPFFTTPEQRLALARERFFEDGIRPSGMVNEAVIQSWSRCLQQRRDPSEPLAFEPVTESRIRSALARSRTLLETAHAELRQLETTLAGTACTVVLTDPHGVVVHVARPPARHDEFVLPLAARIGVNLGEGCIGTGAPGITALTGQASVVLGAEHFFGCAQSFRCAAAPIRDVRGEVAGVLDLSTESRPFGFDAAHVVGLFATAIENRLLRAQSGEHVVVHLQTSPSLLNTPMEGLVGVTAAGSIAWANTAAARLLGIATVGSGLDVETVLALSTARLASLTRRSDPAPHRLPSGLNVWLRTRMHAPDGLSQASSASRQAPDASRSPLPMGTPTYAAPASQPAQAAAGTSLRRSSRQLIEQTLQECGGNVSSAAKRLGVSRGLIYRNLKSL